MRRHAPGLMLAGIVLGVAALAASFGLDYHLRQTDELVNVDRARALLDDPGAFFSSDFSPRGPERLTALLLAVVFALTPGTATGFDAAHVLAALLWASAAIPAYLLARHVGAGRLGALVPAALAVLGPWLVFAVPLLNTAPGYAATAWLILAMWHAVVHPSVRADALVLLALGAVALARVGNVPLVAALPIAVLALARRDRSGLRAIVAEHRLLVLAALVGLVYLALAGRDGLVGEYENTPGLIPDAALWDRAKLLLVRSAAGLLLLVPVLAAAWIARGLRRGDRERFAFAALAVGLVVALAWTVQASTAEERYYAPLAFVIAVAGGTALVAGGVRVLGVAVAGAALAVLVVQDGALYPTDEPFASFFAPGSQVVRRVGAGRVTDLTPLSGDGAVLLLVAGAVAVALVVALVPRARPVVAAGALLAAAAGAIYPADRFLDTTGRRGAPTAHWTFADTEDAPVAVLADGGPELIEPLQDLAYFNERVEAVLVPQDTPAAAVPPRTRVLRLALDRRAGTWRSLDGPVPPLVAQPNGWRPYVLAGEPVDGRRALPFSLDRAGGASGRLAAVALGTVEPDGWGRPGEPVRLRLFTECVRFLLTVPALGADAFAWSAVSGSTTRSGTLPARGTTAVEMPAATTLAVTLDRPGQLDDLRRVGPRVTDVRAC